MCKLQSSYICGEIKNQINKIVDKIKPIDAEKLHDLVIENYKNL